MTDSSNGTTASLLWSLYASEREFIRHHETQRTTASNILAAIAAGLIATFRATNDNIAVSIIVPILIIGIGVVGFLFCGKLYSLIKMHANRSYGYLKEIERNFPDVSINKVKRESLLIQSVEHPIFQRVRLNVVWISFHGLIICAGIALLGLSVYDAFFSFPPVTIGAAS